MSDPTPFRHIMQCAFVSELYGNCPEPVAWAVNLDDNEQWLCERCYRNVKTGRFNGKLKMLAAAPVSHIRDIINTPTHP
jgi:hypothetical protein